MDGKNELHLNHGTMIKAVQYYLEKIMVPPVPKVVSIKKEDKSRGGDNFVVEIEGGSPE